MDYISHAPYDILRECVMRYTRSVPSKSSFQENDSVILLRYDVVELSHRMVLVWHILTYYKSFQ